MERNRTIFDMNTDELYAYASGASSARRAVIESETSGEPFTYDSNLVRVSIPEDIKPNFANLYMSGFREVAAEAITKTAQMETAK